MTDIGIVWHGFAAEDLLNVENQTYQGVPAWPFSLLLVTSLSDHYMGNDGCVESQHASGYPNNHRLHHTR